MYLLWNNIVMEKIIIYAKHIIKVIKKNDINLFAASTSFYMILAIFSLLILVIQLNNYINLDNFIINNIIDLINPYYLESFENIIPIFSLNSFSPILLINLIWSSSKYINGFNKASDVIYNNEKNRNIIVNRLSSIFIFLLILIAMSLELITILFANVIINYIIKNMILYAIIQFVIEFILIFTIILLINKYVPPIKVRLKDVYFTSFISTILIYFLLLLFLLLIKFFERININFNIITIISLSFIIIYFINYCIILGLLSNYYMKKKPNLYINNRE